MSDYVHSGRRSAKGKSIESHIMFAVCWVLFLARAIVGRIVPSRSQAVVGTSGRRESIFSEARTAASVSVTSSFIGF